jgi:hypothetical protein
MDRARKTGPAVRGPAEPLGASIGACVGLLLFADIETIFHVPQQFDLAFCQLTVGTQKCAPPDRRNCLRDWDVCELINQDLPLTREVDADLLPKLLKQNLQLSLDPREDETTLYGPHSLHSTLLDAGQSLIVLISIWSGWMRFLSASEIGLGRHCRWPIGSARSSI